MSTQKRFIAEADARSILKRGSYGVLVTVSPEGKPYGVPLNYFYAEEENCVFFHCAAAGRKLENLRANSSVSFVVVGFEDVIPHKITTYYESAMVFGEARIVTDVKEKKEKLTSLCLKYGTGREVADAAIEKCLPATELVKIEIQKITGKRNRG